MINLFKYRLKVLFNNKESLFWSIMFPIFLATLFSFAFSNLTNAEKFETVKTGVLLNDSIKADVAFNVFLSNNKSLEVKEYTDEVKINEELNKGNIVGYYKKESNIELVVKENGIYQTMLQYMLTGYLQSIKLGENIYKETGKFDSNIFSVRDNHIDNEESKNTNLTMSYIYTLIAMSALYAAYNALYALTTTEANLSKVGARFSAGPTHKIKLLIVNLLCGTLFAMVGMTILFMYLLLVLKVDFGNNALLAYIVSIFGILNGIAIGLFVSSVFRISETAKGVIISLVVMVMSGLSGMFSNALKMYVDDKLPFLNKYNPAALITDSMNYLYRYNELFVSNLIRLSVVTIILLSISYIFIRRKKYDSI